MSDLTTLPPETFFRLAVERGGLDLEEAVHGLSPEAAAALRHIAAAPATKSLTSELSPPEWRSADAKEWEVTRSASRSIPMWELTAVEEETPPRSSAICRFFHRIGDRLRPRSSSDDLLPPAPAITLDDMVDAEQITPEQADELRDLLLDWRQNYPAGTRYSVFGGPS